MGCSKGSMLSKLILCVLILLHICVLTEYHYLCVLIGVWLLLHIYISDPADPGSGLYYDPKRPKIGA